MMTHLVLYISYIVIGGFFNILRGGGLGGQSEPGLLNLSGWLKKWGLPAPRSLLIVSIFQWPLGYTLLTLSGFGTMDAVLLSFVIAEGYFLSMMKGWGTYFDIGTNPADIRSHRENSTIDWILSKIYGATWIPASMKNTIAPLYDLVESPTGDYRPYAWRRNRDTLGMCLRMSMLSFLFIQVAAYQHYFLDVSLVKAATVAGILSVAGMGVGLIYRSIVTYEMFARQSPIWRFWQPIGLSEIVAGLYIHSLILIALFV